MALFGLALLAPLVVARSLEPEGQGRGTHQQLGLPPCTVVLLFGRPCPVCGMTTSWANLTRGRLIDALGANVGGTTLAAIGILAVPWLLFSAVRGRWIGWIPNSTTIVWVASGVMIVTLIDWGIRLSDYH